MTKPNKEKCTRGIYLRCTQSFWLSVAQASLDSGKTRTQFIIEAVEKALAENRDKS